MKTNEEKIAEKMASHLTDFTLDLDAVGKYLGIQPFLLYNRFLEVSDSALYYQEQQSQGREQLSDNIDERFEQYRSMD